MGQCFNGDVGIVYLVAAGCRLSRQAMPIFIVAMTDVNNGADALTCFEIFYFTTTLLKAKIYRLKCWTENLYELMQRDINNTLVKMTMELLRNT